MSPKKVCHFTTARGRPSIDRASPMIRGSQEGMRNISGNNPQVRLGAEERQDLKNNNQDADMEIVKLVSLVRNPFCDRRILLMRGQGELNIPQPGRTDEPST